MAKETHWRGLKWWIRYRLLRPKALWNEILWEFLCRTFKRFDIVKLKTLEPGYYDVDTRMLHACFNLLVHFVEKEQPFERLNWETTEEERFVAGEIRELYRWWTRDYPNRRTAIEELPPELRPPPPVLKKQKGVAGSYFDPSDWIRRDLEYPAYCEASKKTQEQQEMWKEEEQENLIRLIRIRFYLWT